MPFRLLEEQKQRQLTMAKLGLPFFVFVVGFIITAILANTFHQSEIKFQHENLKSITREFYRSQNLVLNNSILRIQSFNEISNLVRSKNTEQRSVVKAILANTMFQRASLYILNSPEDSENLPELTMLRRFKTESDKLPGSTTNKLQSQYLKRKIQHMLSDNSPNSVALNVSNDSYTISLIWRSEFRKKDFIIFLSTLDDFFKDWPKDQDLVALLHDRQSNLEILVTQDKVTKKFIYKTDPVDILQAQKNNKFLIYSHFLVNENYGISVDWMQTSTSKPSYYVLMIIFFGLSISLLSALFVRFILDQNRRIYKLVVSRTEQLEHAMNQAQEANQAKTRFLANMSHELRTPLNLILGMIDLLQVNNPDRKSLDYLKNMQAAGEHLLNLITDLLSMSKEEVSDLKINRFPINVPVFFEEIGFIIGPECRRKKLDFSISISHDIPSSLTGDPVKIRQILLNLLRNSLKYTTIGRLELNVSLFKREVDPEDVCHIRFEVIDTGVGIPKNKMNMIFDRFFQVEDSKILAEGGVGLGLSIVRDLVSKMNGNITVKSEIGQGSSFTVDLDLECRDRTPWIQQYQLSKNRQVIIAVITDSASVFSQLSRTLPSEYFKLTSFNSASVLESGAQDLFAEAHFLVISDCKTSVIKKIRNLELHKKIILIGNDEDIKELESLQNITVIERTPILSGQLFEALQFRASKRRISSTPGKDTTEDDDIVSSVANTVSILAVDDDSGNRELLRAYLNDPHYYVTFATDGLEALDQYKKSRPDLIIADLRMPNMNGFELAQSIKKLESGTDYRTPIILLTADALETTLNEAQKYEISVFLTKPIRRIKLLNAVHEVLQMPSVD